MRQLTALDAQFLALETPRQYGHVAGVAVVDPSTSPTGSLELADLQDLLVERLPLLPPLRWRLAEGRDVPGDVRFSDDGEPTDLGMLGRGLLGLPRYPLRVLRALPGTLPNLDETPLATLPGAGTLRRIASSVQRAVGGGGDEIVDRHKLVAPKTSFNGRVSPHRRVVFGQLSLDDVKAVKNEHGCTVNDVIVSMCAGAVRRWMIEHGELLDDPLVTQIPVSVRTDDQVGTYGNRIQLMSAPLFTNV